MNDPFKQAIEAAPSQAITASVPAIPSSPANSQSSFRIGRSPWPRRLTILGFYLVTWVGGCTSFSRDFNDQAQASYRSALLRKTQLIAAGQEIRVWDEVREGGPYVRVNWCIPLLPGVLLLDADRAIGPLNGKGGARIVLYNGWRTFEALELWGWIS